MPSTFKELVQAWQLQSLLWTRAQAVGALYELAQLLGDIGQQRDADGTPIDVDAAQQVLATSLRNVQKGRYDTAWQESGLDADEKQQVFDALYAAAWKLDQHSRWSGDLSTEHDDALWRVAAKWTGARGTVPVRGVFTAGTDKPGVSIRTPDDAEVWSPEDGIVREVGADRIVIETPAAVSTAGNFPVWHVITGIRRPTVATNARVGVGQPIATSAGIVHWEVWRGPTPADGMLEPVAYLNGRLEVDDPIAEQPDPKPKPKPKPKTPKPGDGGTIPTTDGPVPPVPGGGTVKEESDGGGLGMLVGAGIVIGLIIAASRRKRRRYA